MSQFGMQVGTRRRAAGPDVYTAMAIIACAFLVAAIAVMFVAGGKVSPDGQPWTLQGDRVQFAR